MPQATTRTLLADRGYDSRAFRDALRSRGIRLCIPLKRRPAQWKAKRGRPVVARQDDRQRHKVERNFAWLSNFRRLLIRWEHLSEAYASDFAIAVLLVCFPRPMCAPKVSLTPTHVG
jgi:transposase